MWHYTYLYSVRVNESTSWVFNKCPTYNFTLFKLSAAINTLLRQRFGPTPPCFPATGRVYELSLQLLLRVPPPGQGRQVLVLVGGERRAALLNLPRSLHSVALPTAPHGSTGAVGPQNAHSDGSAGIRYCSSKEPLRRQKELP